MLYQVEQGIASVDRVLDRVVQTKVEMLQESSHHIIRAGGKRLRPQVVFLSYLAAGGDDLTTVVPLAAAIELVHTATLVHDDVVTVMVTSNFGCVKEMRSKKSCIEWNPFSKLRLMA